jgi:hypothetical protein
MKISMAQILFPIIVILFFILLMGCGSYTPPKVASHIVAVTLQGDTILVPIEKIRPNMYQSYYPVYSSYNYYRPYYGNEYRFRYNDNRGFSKSSNNTNNNSKNNPKSIPTVPDIVTRPSSDVLMKNKK